VKYFHYPFTCPYYFSASIFTKNRSHDDREKETSISISLDNTELKQVLEFNYLGITFTENGRMDREIEIRCNKAKKVIDQLSPILKTQNSTHEDQKTSYTKHIYSNFVLSMLNMDT
jgi:hypothetical protein